VSLLRRALGGDAEERDSSPLNFDTWANYFNFNGLSYGLNFAGTSGQPADEISGDFAGYVQGIYKANGVVFACVAARMRLFSEARFQFQQLRNGRPGDLFGTAELQVLETPWKNGSTSDLLKRALVDADLGGNSFNRRQGDKIIRMRPDWTTIVAGSETGDASDAEPLGYVYQPGGPGSGKEPILYLPEQVAHFAPVPDPEYRFKGMSWLTAVLREIMGDGAATTHKLKFFENGATPNMVVVRKDDPNEEKFKLWMRKIQGGHDGLFNAYKTLYLSAGADAKVVGADMKQIDFKVTQGHGETRIAAAAGVPPIIVGLSEGLEAATYSNYGQARRAFADGTMRPLWRDMAGSLAPLVKVPKDSRLWYDARDISFLQEDEKDAAEIQQVQSITIKQLVEAGYKPETVVAAVMADDMNLLEHTGFYSVQLQQPGAETSSPNNKPALPAIDAASAEGRVLRALQSRN
jgi:hypothetical protein